jgi:hypothetical protein
MNACSACRVFLTEAIKVVLVVATIVFFCGDWNVYVYTNEGKARHFDYVGFWPRALISVVIAVIVAAVYLVCCVGVFRMFKGDR